LTSQLWGELKDNKDDYYCVGVKTICVNSQPSQVECQGIEYLVVNILTANTQYCSQFVKERGKSKYLGTN